MEQVKNAMNKKVNCIHDALLSAWYISSYSPSRMEGMRLGLSFPMEAWGPVKLGSL